MSDYYTLSGAPATGAAGDSSVIRAEFALISAGFDKLPDLTTVANRVVHVNSGSSALATTSGFTFDGTTLTVSAIAVTTLAVTDSTFSIKDNSDATKIAQFQCSGITTATTRTYTLPDATGTVVVSDGVATVGVAKYSADAVASTITGKKSRHATFGSHTIVQSGDDLLSITAYGSNGTSFDPAAQILMEVGGTPGASNDMPGKISFLVCPDGSATLAEAMSIASSKLVTVASGLTITSGDLTISNGEFSVTENSGNTNLIVTNSASGANIQMDLLGSHASSGNVAIRMRVGGSQNYTFGINTADSNAFVISAYLGLGTNNGLRIDTTGLPYFPSHDTTASAANAYLDSGNGKLQRSTSSLRYKRDVEFADADRVNAVLTLQPIWYRSKCAGDRQDWSYYGLGAEDVAAVDPRLVHWTPEVIGTDEHGQPIRGENLIPDGVMYERVSVLLLGKVKEMETRLRALEAR